MRQLHCVVDVGGFRRRRVKTNFIIFMFSRLREDRLSGDLFSFVSHLFIFFSIGCILSFSISILTYFII